MLLILSCRSWCVTVVCGGKQELYNKKSACFFLLFFTGWMCVWSTCSCSEMVATKTVLAAESVKLSCSCYTNKYLQLWDQAERQRRFLFSSYFVHMCRRNRLIWMKTRLQKTPFVLRGEEAFQPFGAGAQAGPAAAGLLSLSALLMENIPLLCCRTGRACCISTRPGVDRSDFGWKAWGLFENPQRCEFTAASFRLGWLKLQSSVSVSGDAAEAFTRSVFLKLL